MEYQTEASGQTSPRVVVIAIDESSHTEDAVNCEFPLSALQLVTGFVFPPFIVVKIILM